MGLSRVAGVELCTCCGMERMLALGRDHDCPPGTHPPHPAHTVAVAATNAALHAAAADLAWNVPGVPL